MNFGTDFSNTLPLIIAHGGYDHDFPLMLASCMKHKCDYSALHNYSFLDSMLLLKEKGYSKLGLASLIGKKVRHSALKMLKTYTGFIIKLMFVLC